MSVATIPTLKARLLGPSEIAIGDRILGRQTWKGRKARSLLLILLNAGGFQVHREVVLDLLWPDLDLDAGNNALYKTLHSLRRTLEPTVERGRGSHYIETLGETIRIVPTVPLWTDVDQFTTLVAQSSASAPGPARMLLRRALDLHRDRYLADEPYAEWATARRAMLSTEREQAALTLATLDRDAGDSLATVPYLEALLLADPLVEPIHRALMQAYAEGGQRELALRQFERCRETLDRELGEAPEPETIRLAQAIRAQTPAMHTSLIPASLNHGFLPALPSRTVGRDAEIERVANLLADSETRLVTVVGPGGVGKTRLATTAALQVRTHFSDGANFVSLAAVSDATMLFDAIATALHLHDDPTRIKQELVTAYLQSRSMLLVLDNLEQLAEAATDIADLLTACPSLTVLATSRTPLRLRAERLLRLAPLALPDPTLDLHLQPGATELFWQLLDALDAAPDTTADHRSVADLCIVLDGLPLAIELAAARCSDRSPAAVLAQIQEHSRLAFLRDGPRDLPDRQQTLEDVVRWSYDLLPTADQMLFRQLALFPSGVEADTLQMLAGNDAHALATALAEASLAQWVVVDGVRRLTMLQTIRDVAHLLLEQAGELPSLRDRQGSFYRELAATAARGHEGVNQVEAMARFRRELDTLRGMLDWAGTAETTSIPALEIMVDTGWLWETLGLVREGCARIRQVLENIPATPTVHHVLGVATLGRMALRLASFDEARAWASQARDLAAQVQDPIGILQAGKLRSQLLQRDSELDASVELNQRLLPLARRTGNPVMIMDRLIALGIAMNFKGELESARDYLDEALAMAHETTNHLYASRALAIQVGVAYNLGDFETMQVLLEQTEQVATLVSDLHTLAWTTYYQTGLLADLNDHAGAAAAALRASSLFAGIGSQRMVAGARVSHAVMLGHIDPPAALEAFGQTIDLVEAMGNVEEYLSCVLQVGYLARHVGQADAGLTLMMAAREGFHTTGEAFNAREETWFRERHTETRALLDTPSADAAEAAGRAMPIEDAIRLARQVCATATPAGTTAF